MYVFLIVGIFPLAAENEMIIIIRFQNIYYYENNACYYAMCIDIGFMYVEYAGEAGTLYCG